VRQAQQIRHLEGNTVLAYTVDGEIEASMFLHSIEETYFSFRSRRRDTTQAKVCYFSACARMPELDLKFVAHHGQFVRDDVEERVKLTVNDVIVDGVEPNLLQQPAGLGCCGVPVRSC
jgi:hypothetical protein